MCHEIVLSGHLKGLLIFLSSLLVNFRSAKALLGIYTPEEAVEEINWTSRERFPEELQCC